MNGKPAPEQIDLAYPLYLNVSMMTSFVAALEDGIAYVSDVTQRGEQHESRERPGRG